MTAESNGHGTRTKVIGYRVTTGIVVFCMTGGFFELPSVQTTVHGIMRLGYPAYIVPALGLGKILAILALLWPGLPRLKEWAYAGIFFNMLGAFWSHLASRTIVETARTASPGAVPFENRAATRQAAIFISMLSTFT